MSAPGFNREHRFRHQLAGAAANEVETLARDYKPDIVLCFDMLAAWFTAGLRERKIVWIGSKRPFENAARGSS